ncbi:MAG: three-Cys-motif partner protein TcmP [Gemmatimonadales bacterium]
MKKAHKEHFERFEAHTLLKHGILRRYLQTWARKLLLPTTRAFDKIWFVDAFAGAGADEQGNPGSPLIAVRIAQEVERDLKSRGMIGRVRVLAIEKEKVFFDKLEERLKPYSEGVDPTALLRNGTLAERIDGFTRHVGDDPVLYFLDPFGVDGLRKDLLAKALAGPRNEVFVLFSDLGAARLMAALTKERRDENVELASILSQPGLFADLDEALIEARSAEIAQSNERLAQTQSAADRIMTDAVGPEGIERLRGLPWDLLQDEAVKAWTNALIEAGAKKVIAMPIRNADGQRLHQLVYASKHSKGFVAMKEAMDTSVGLSLLPESVREAMNLDVAVDEVTLLRVVTERFGGIEHRWTGPAGIKEFLDVETAAFPSQIQRLRATMKERGWQVRGKPIVMRIPSQLDE